MMNLTNPIFPAHFLDSLGWAIVHSLWQGLAALSLMLIFRAFSQNKSPATHYIVQITCLSLCFISFLGTFAWYFSGTPDTSIGGLLEFSNAGTIAGSTSQTALEQLSLQAGAFGVTLKNITPIVGVLWCIGFALMAARYLGAYYITQQLKTKDTSPVSKFWTTRFFELTNESRVTNKVRLLISKHVDGPLTIGFFKPVVLVPASFLTSLPQDQIEAILLHELAHIRRFDYLLNLIQTSIKTVLFYHPAIHIICRFIDENREQACDDLAVSQTDDPQSLALGLAQLRLQADAGLGMAANNKQTPLLNRLKRLVGPNEFQKRPEQIIFSILTAILIGLFVAGCSSSIADSMEKKSDSDVPKFSNIHNEYYSFESTSIDGRNITVKKVGDGSRWVLVNNSWYDVDRNPHVVNKMSDLPIPPQAPSMNRCQECEAAGNYNYKEMEKYQKKMAQFKINMEYYAAEMKRYAREQAKLFNTNQNKNLNNNINRNINKNINENRNYNRAYNDVDILTVDVLGLDSKLEQQYKKFKNQRRSENLSDAIAQEVVRSLLEDNVISGNDHTTSISQVNNKIHINGEPLSSPLCGKYEYLKDQFELNDDVIVEITTRKTITDVASKRALDT